MELDILKQNTTWNDASASINNNFAKVKTAIEQGGGGTGGGGGASIPVVSSEEELESLSQNKGDLAVILSDDEIKSGNVRCLDLPSISMATVQQYDFSECASVQGIAINTEVDVPPCPSFAGQNIQFIIAPRKMKNPLKASFLAFDLSEPFDDDGYCRGTLQVTMVQGGNGSSALPLAQYDNSTGKMVLVDSRTIAELNSLVIGAMIEDPVLVSYSEMVQAGGEGLKDTLAFFECISSVAKFGTKSIRVKDDEGYSRLDSDIIKVADKKAISSLNSLDMPIGSLVRVHYPEEPKYDTDIATMRCCIIEPEFDSSKATVLNKVEFTRACTTEELEEDAANLPPYLVLTDRNGSQFCEVEFEVGGDGSLLFAVKFSMDEGKTYSHLLQDGVWNEELIEEFDAMVSSGVNVLYKLGKAGNSLWNEETGICTYLEGGGLDEETLSQISMVMEMMIGAYVQFRYNERQIPERIEEYDRVTKGWVKKNELANVTFKTINGEEVIGEGDISIEGGTEEIYIGDTQPTDENIKIWIDTSVEGTTGGGTSGGSITVDAEMSDTSVNSVQNKVIKKYVDDEVEDAKAYSEEMADNAEKAAKQYTDEKIAANGGGTSSSASFPIYISEPVTEDSSTWFYTANSGSYCIATYVKGRKAKEVRTPTPNSTNGLAVPMSMIELDFSKIHTGLTFPNVVWKDEAAPTFEDGAKYLVKVFNGMAEWGKYGSIRVFDFKIAGNACQALEGMTWGQYIDSKYNVYGFYWDGSTIRNPQWGSSVYIAEAPSKTTLIVEGKNYTTANGAVFPI